MHQETVRLHFPSSHAREQHSSSDEQSLPATLQDGFRAAQVPSSPQMPPQHSVSRVQSPPSEVQAPSPHVPSSQSRLQQSVGAPHGEPGAAQALTDDSQVSVSGLHVDEQHSDPNAHGSPTAPQVGPVPPVVPSPDAPEFPFVPPVALEPPFAPMSPELPASPGSATPAVPPLS